MAFHCIHCRAEISPNYKACPFCGEPITDFLRRHLESPVDGKYQIVSRLGVGGMGEVYKVIHTHLNAIRVIKLMRSNIENDPGAHERFLREARLATKINHPNVATLFDFSTLPDGSHYMVWEYIEGINLHELMEQRGPLSPRYAARLAVQALHGLEAIHRAGIVHRDVSPENLMILRDEEGEERVKIIDLGIAKQWGDEENKTKTGMFVGKWKYCSPEHLGMLPDKQRIDGRADLYSFGIVLYEMVTGLTPFHADTPHGYLMLHASEKPRPLHEVNPSVASAPELEAVILRALEKDRNKRFASAREFAQALEKLIPSLADKPGAPVPAVTVAQITEEPTRPARIGSDAPTVVSVSTPHPASATVQDAAATVRTVAPMFLRRPGPKALRWGGVAAAVAIVVFGIALAMWRKSEPAPVAPAQPARTEATVVAPATGRLAIHAFPWGNVTSIRNVTTGQPVALDAEVVTPAPIDLMPGRYEVTLVNPAFKKPITRTIEVAAGRDEIVSVHFSDPATAALPRFEGGPK